ncbi:hypothetical protein [Dyella nitratireducens]|uniref:Uncharacterized protein n=1 Tax=Dyella nitratireducens TaxID=1849580 RepID=A0ABQ1FN46_9GAMM|nr:hypothetical protein [Dyella nitratireducens]GGA23480.1 hypothetical protein GCM10010981_09750 [Dyella nitratireducens]GLQ43962.1 hypothetical protein GCM10007902_38120 [Dyella nitratireducens]
MTLSTGIDIPAITNPADQVKPIDVWSDTYLDQFAGRLNNVLNSINVALNSHTSSVNRWAILEKLIAMQSELLEEAEALADAAAAGDPGAASKLQVVMHLLEEVSKAIQNVEQSLHSTADNAIQTIGR